ncbi:MAG: hypothetical protein AAB289_11730 [Chloroflexota bacterium]
MAPRTPTPPNSTSTGCSPRRVQAAHSQAAQTNSRRLDVAPGNPESLVVEGRKAIFNLSDEASTAEQMKTIEILLKMVR